MCSILTMCQKKYAVKTTSTILKANIFLILLKISFNKIKDYTLLTILCLKILRPNKSLSMQRY